MMSDKGRESDVYDPFKVELQSLKELGLGEMPLDFNNPIPAKFLAQQLILRVLELRESKIAVEGLRSRNDSLRDEIEELRVSNGQLTERSRFSWIEFPAGILCGIAGNLITSDKYNFFAWVLLLLGLAFFVILRLPQLLGKATTSVGKGRSNA